MRHFTFKIQKKILGRGMASSPDLTPWCPLNSPPLDNTSGSATVTCYITTPSDCYSSGTTTTNETISLNLRNC